MRREYTPLDLPDDPDFGQKMRDDFFAAFFIAWFGFWATIVIIGVIF